MPAWKAMNCSHTSNTCQLNNYSKVSMSLLIKALHKAEQEKASERESTTAGTSEPFELARREVDLSTESGVRSAEPVRAGRTDASAGTQTQKAAGVIFAAKSRDESSTKTLVLTGVILLIL